MYFFSSGALHAKAGAHSWVNGQNMQSQVVTFQRHQLYNPNTLINDIAILTFENAFTINEYVVPIQTPEPQTGEWMTNGTPARVCGWGNTEPIGQSMPALLHCVNTHIISKDLCNGVDSYQGEVLRGNFCAGEWGVGGKDACQEDSGGPLTIEFSDDSVGILVGATSWGFGCALPSYPGVYTDIAMFMNWVNDQLNNN